MTDGARQRSSTSGSAKDAAAEKESGGGVALKKEIGLVSACGIIVGELQPNKPVSCWLMDYWTTQHSLKSVSESNF